MEKQAEQDELKEAEVQVLEFYWGRKNHSKMASWAMENLPKAEIEEPKNKCSDRNTIVPMVRSFQQHVCHGTEPNLISGDPHYGPNPESTQEVVAVMSDKRYGKDVTGTKMFKTFGNSDVFTRLMGVMRRGKAAAKRKVYPRLR